MQTKNVCIIKELYIYYLAGYQAAKLSAKSVSGIKNKSYCTSPMSMVHLCIPLSKLGSEGGACSRVMQLACFSHHENQLPRAINAPKLKFFLFFIIEY